MSTIIQSKRVWLDEAFCEAQIELTDKKITNIYKYNELKVDHDYGENRIIPGLLDIHTHGFNGMDANYATSEGLKAWQKALALEGVTSFMVTTSTAPYEKLLESYELIANTKEQELEGAKILGIHVEGPMISHEFKGAHNPYMIEKPTIETFEAYQRAAKGNIKMLCLGIECDDNFKLTNYCVEKGIKVVIGHTGADFETCVEAQKQGATSFTHLFNAMSPLNHRNPGAVGAALSLDEMYSELICDGVHVHFNVCKIVGKCKRSDRLILITDSVQIKGLKPGIYEMPGRVVEVKEDGCGRLKDGRLAGSSNKMITMLKNAIEKCDMSEVMAIKAATINPATYVNASGKGLIKVQFDGDIIVIDDDYNVLQTFIEGSIIK